MNFAVAMAIVTLTGFIALSYEILWARLYSFVSGASSNSFGILLGAYLLGLSLGSLFSGFLCRRDDPCPQRHRKQLALLVLLASLAGFLLTPTVGFLVQHVHYHLTLVALVFASAALGAVLPLICHMAIAPDQQAGARLSYLYVANIVGSSAGSLLTGFWLMDHFGLVELSTSLGVVGVALSAALRWEPRARPPWAWLATCCVVISAVVAGSPSVHDRLFEKLQWKNDLGPDYRFAKVYESKSGVITIGPQLTIFGGGMFDGYLRTELTKGTWLVRPYSLSLFHPAPRRVLQIGVSGGAWANVLVNNPEVETLIGVEINRRYLDVMADHPTVSPILSHAKATLVIDDGRRWMLRNPDEKFDAIVINTTWHYRSFASNLLSKEFMELVRDRLAPGGIYLFNATGSKDAHQTAMAVFPHTMMVLNNVVASSEPLRYDPTRWRDVLLRHHVGGRAVVDLGTEEGRDCMDWLMSVAQNVDRVDPTMGTVVIASRGWMTRDSDGGRVVTDDNMRTEW
jgi:predicted membrane-bound spermidine synthase